MWFDHWVGKIPWRSALATHSSILAWRSPWTEEPGGLQSVGLQGVRHDWSDLVCTHGSADWQGAPSPQQLDKGGLPQSHTQKLWVRIWEKEVAEIITWESLPERFWTTDLRPPHVSWCQVLFLNGFLNWSIVNLQCCVSFRYTAKWISYTYMYICLFFRISFTTGY